jgi:hypothetical protein
MLSLVSNSCIININNKNKIDTFSQKSPKSNSNLDKEYSLKQNFFDPSKGSPPNDFMLKLKQRMSVYESFINLNKDDNEKLI